jgi:hypothetical protein
MENKWKNKEVRKIEKGRKIWKQELISTPPYIGFDDTLMLSAMVNRKNTCEFVAPLIIMPYE